MKAVYAESKRRNVNIITKRQLKNKPNLLQAQHRAVFNNFT